MPDDFDRMWAELAPLGRSATSDGYFRQPFGSAERECHAWFVAQCEARGLRVEHDGNGNTVGWWEPSPEVDAVGDSAVLTGSHLDSVLDGGAYDGPPRHARSECQQRNGGGGFEKGHGPRV